MKSILIQGVQVKTTVTIDDALYQKALKTFVRVEAGKRLADLGSSNPTMADIPRHRGPSK